MKGTISIGRLEDSQSFRVIFYGVEIPEGLDPAAAYIARGVDDLDDFLQQIGMDSNRRQTVKDELKLQRSTEVLDYSAPDDVLKRFGLI